MTRTPPASRYVYGDPYSKWALLVYPQRRWRLPWQRPRGGWLFAHYGLWWDGGAKPPEDESATILPFPPGGRG